MIVPVTARCRTADGADIRVLLEADVATAARSRTAELEIERVAMALVVPAAEEAVRRRDLASLVADPSLDLTHVGGDLLTVRVVAVEHLIASPSADPAPADGSKRRGRR